MLTIQDRQRLLESRHDLEATNDATTLSAEEGLQGAIKCLHDKLDARRQTLVTKARKTANEARETEAAQLKLSTAHEYALNTYLLVSSRCRSALLDLDPDDVPRAEEVSRRQRLFERIFEHDAKTLRGLGSKKFTEVIEALADALDGDAITAALGLTERLRKAVLELSTATPKLEREVREDRAAMDELRDARLGHDRSLAALALQVEPALRDAGREAELGRYILARDPAYVARRKVGSSLDEETGIDAVDAETPVAETSPAPGEVS